MLETLIRKLELHGPISEDETRFLENAIARVIEYRTGDLIVREGETPSESCLIVSGLACGFKSLAGGTRQILAFHIPGDFCDLHSFVLKQMNHSIAAIDQCTVAKVPHAKLKEATESFPGLTRALWWDTAIDAAIHREWMVCMGRRDAYQQMAHLFCELLVRFQSVGLADGNSYTMPATQHDLGDALGLSTVHVNRTLQRLRADELITSKGKMVSILDPERLMRAAEFDPVYLEVRGRPQR